MLEDLCNSLKKKRAELGLSLEEVVEKTKVHPSAIKAIESGKLDTIDSVYLKGYLKIYSSFLGVPLGDELKNIAPKKEKKPLRQKEAAPKKPVNFSEIIPVQVRKNIGLLSIIIVLVILLIVLVSSLIAGIKEKRGSWWKHEPPQVGDSVPAAAPVAVKPVVKPTTPVVPAKPPALVVTPAAPAPVKELPKDVSVSLIVKRDCFVRVKVDGKLVFEGVLRQGVTENWEGKEELEFKISDGSSVDLEVNGRLYSPLSKIRTPIKSLKVTSGGIVIDK